MTTGGAVVTFETFSTHVRGEVERRLELIFEAKLGQLDQLGRVARVFGQVVRDLTMRGGKRLRAVLVAAGFVSIRPDADLAPALVAGAAFELLQSYFLIHDDWMDGDTVRRGGPTAHVALAGSLGGSKLGDSAAILAGDYALALAQECLCSAGGEDRAVVRAMSQFAQVQLETVSGQLLDLTMKERALDDMRLETLKTASYTVRGPLLVGAALAGADDRAAQICAAFATPIGVAFQLQDDLLNLIGDSAKTGKPVGSDVRAGKLTLPIRYALAHLDARRRDGLLETLGREDATDQDVARAIEFIGHSGALKATKARIADLTTEALRHLAAEPPLSPLGISLLTEVAHRLTGRAA
jgi:geranylgeranyl diphosphate synthase, type I